MAIRILITDRNQNIVGDPIDNFKSLEVTTKFNEPASGNVVLPAEPAIMAQLQPGNRIVIIRDGSVWTEGPLEIPQQFEWSADDVDAAGPGRVTAYFTDDLAVIAGRITFADPTLSWANQPLTANYAPASANAEVLIRSLVNLNAGPGALTGRQVPGLALVTTAGIGSTTKLVTRFEPLLDACRRLALNGGGLGFHTYAESGGLRFRCYAPADLTATARFSIGLGNLRQLSYTGSAPTVTRAYVSGTLIEGDPNSVPPVPDARTFVPVSDTAAGDTWWPIEAYVDGSADSDADGELTADGQEELANGAAPVELATVTVDTPDLRAGVDYGLGDRVTVVLPTGLEVTDVVRAIQLNATPESGELVTSVIGSPDATTDPATVRLLRDLGRRLGRIAAR